MRRADDDFNFLGDQDCDAIADALASIDNPDFIVFSVQPHMLRAAKVRVVVIGPASRKRMRIEFVMPYGLAYDLEMKAVVHDLICDSARRFEATPPAPSPQPPTPARADR